MTDLDLDHLEELERGATPSEFIDAARRAAPALFKRVRELEAENERLRACGSADLDTDVVHEYLDSVATNLVKLGCFDVSIGCDKSAGVVDVAYSCGWNRGTDE